MKLAASLSRFFIAAFILGMACSLSGTTASTQTPAPTVAPVLPTIAAPTVSSVATIAPPTARPQVAQNTNPQTNLNSSAPVILLLTSGSGTLGDIYTWDASTQALKQLTTWGYNFAPHISPDGQWLAYLSVSQAGVTAMQSGAMNPQVYANIWLFDPYTQESIRIADQPANATYAAGNLIRRTSDPVWSPDGQSVAWVESDTQGERLAIYAVASKNTATYQLNLPPICCEGASRTLYWGQSGIAMVANEGTFDKSQQVAYIFSPQGVQLARIVLATDTYLEYGWAVNDANHEYLAGVTNGMFTLIDPFSSGGDASHSYPEMVSVSSPGEFAIRPSHNPALWTVTRQGQSITDLNNISDIRQMSIAPDGHSLVYVQGDILQGGKAFVYLANGQTVALNPSQRLLAVTWGATSWRIRTS